MSSTRLGLLRVPGTPPAARRSDTRRADAVCLTGNGSVRGRRGWCTPRRLLASRGVASTDARDPRPCVGAQWCAAPSRPGSAAAPAQPRASAASPATRSARCRTARPGPGSAARWRGSSHAGCRVLSPRAPRPPPAPGRPAPLRPGSGAAGDTRPACVCVGSGRIGKDQEGSVRRTVATSQLRVGGGVEERGSEQGACPLVTEPRAPSRSVGRPAAEHGAWLDSRRQGRRVR